jgi:regulator of replication initiation timing
MSETNKRNFRAIEGAINSLNNQMGELKQKQAALEKQNASLKMELEQVKLLAVTLTSRGTGPTKV